MDVIAPSYITDDTLIACDIPESTTEYPEWDAATSYLTGQRVSVNFEEDGITPGIHTTYECMWHTPANLDLYPPDNLTGTTIWWMRISATERWKLFDMIVAPDRANASANVVGCDWEADTVWESGTIWNTESSSSMMVTVEPGKIDSVAVMNADSYSISVIMTDPLSGEVYNETTISSTATYSNELHEDLPNYPNAEVTVIVRNSDDVNVGEIIFGKLKNLGKTRYGVNVGIVDYSQKEADDFGNFNIIERSFSKRLDCTVMIPIASHSGVMRLLEKYRATPLVWIVSNLYSTTLIYGYYRDFDISVSNPTIAECILSIEGLGADLVQATPIPDEWEEPWDGINHISIPDFMPTVEMTDTTVVAETPVAIDDLDVLEIPAVPDVSVWVGSFESTGTCTISEDEPALVTIAGHGLIDDQMVLFKTTGALPAPLVVGQIYFVMYLDVDTFNLSLTVGGSEIDTTDAGSGTHTVWGLTVESP